MITLASDDVQFHRVDPYDPYLNREIIFVGKEGTLSRPLSNTYATPASVVATAYEPSRPITIRNLRVLRTGVGPGNAIGAVVVYRDFVTMESPQILIEGGHGTTDGLAAGIHLYSCVGSVIRRPYMDGLLLNGYGYGLFLSTTLLTTIEDGHITNCRRAIAGRDNVGVTIRGGVYSHTLDDHWGDRGSSPA